jgi:Tfp pilus assembly protein PilF
LTAAKKLEKTRDFRPKSWEQAAIHAGFKYEDAVLQFQRAVQIDPTNEGAYRGLASAYEHSGSLAEAEKTYQLAIKVRPQYWAGYGWLGSFYSHQAKYKEAPHEFSQAIALAPDDPHGYRELGVFTFTWVITAKQSMF